MKTALKAIVREGVRSLPVKEDSYFGGVVAPQFPGCIMGWGLQVSASAEKIVTSGRWYSGRLHTHPEYARWEALTGAQEDLSDDEWEEVNEFYPSPTDPPTDPPAAWKYWVPPRDGILVFVGACFFSRYDFENEDDWYLLFHLRYWKPLVVTHRYNKWAKLHVAKGIPKCLLAELK